MDLHNKVAIITGGVSGIGNATANTLMSAGAEVVVLDIDPPPDDKPAAYTFRHCNVAKHQDVRDAFAFIAKKYPRIDILINNAGIQTYGSVTETDEELWNRTMDVNVKSMFLCSKYAIPLMQKNKSGVIINISSVQAFVTQERVAAYASSKSAVLGLTRSIAVDYGPHIRCVAVCPGAVMTPMLERDIASYPDQDAIIRETQDIHLLQRIASPQEIANFIAFLSSDLASFATGQYFRVDGGIGVKIQGT